MAITRYAIIMLLDMLTLLLKLDRHASDIITNW